MWWLILGLIGVCAVLVVVLSRRGSTGASRADDLPSGRDRQTPDPGIGHPGFGGGGFGGDGGGA